MNKDLRLKKIREIIKTNRISKQEELILILESAGIFANQSAVSRDLDELGAVKIKGIYDFPEKKIGKTFGLLSQEAVGENLIVAKCEPGMASAICVKIDQNHIENIAGTLAGEDTIFIAVRNHKEQKTVIKKIWEIFESGISDL